MAHSSSRAAFWRQNFAAIAVRGFSFKNLITVSFGAITNYPHISIPLNQEQSFLSHFPFKLRFGVGWCWLVWCWSFSTLVLLPGLGPKDWLLSEDCCTSGKGRNEANQIELLLRCGVCIVHHLHSHFLGPRKSQVHARTWAGCTLPLLRGAVKHMARVGMCNWDETSVNKDAAYLLGIGFLVFFWSPSIPLSAAIQNLALPYKKVSRYKGFANWMCDLSFRYKRWCLYLLSFISAGLSLTHSQQNVLEGCWGLLPDSWGLLALVEVSCHIWRKPDCPEGYWLTSLV